MSQDKPVVIVTDDLVDFGAGVVKSVFPNATDDECGTAAAGAFMAMLSLLENENVAFAYSDEGPFFAFPCSKMRGRQ